MVNKCTNGSSVKLATVSVCRSAVKMSDGLAGGKAVLSYVIHWFESTYPSVPDLSRDPDPTSDHVTVAAIFDHLRCKQAA